MKRILVYSPNPLDGVSFYRQWGPLSFMRDKVTCGAHPMTDEALTNWTWYLNYDIAFISRPHQFRDFVFAEQCKKFGLPIWVDFDDALFHITPDNPVYFTFASEQARKWTLQTLQIADVVSVCSPLQKNWFETELKLKNVVIIPNALDDRFLRYKRPFSANKKVAWRGSPSHLNDLLTFGDEIIDVVNEHPKHEFNFFGIHPTFLTKKAKQANVMWSGTVNIIDFIIGFTEYNPSILFVPLIDNFFNRVKSHLAWLDGTLAGSVVIGPAFEEWIDKPGLLTYKNLGDLLVRTLSASQFTLKRAHDESWEYIRDNLLLSNINNLRLEIINNLERKI